MGLKWDQCILTNLEGVNKKTTDVEGFTVSLSLTLSLYFGFYE